MSNIGYAGHGVEIEDDIDRFRRRKLEFEVGSARRSRQIGRRSWWRRNMMLPGLKPGVACVRRSQS